MVSGEQEHSQIQAAALADPEHVEVLEKTELAVPAPGDEDLVSQHKRNILAAFASARVVQREDSRRNMLAATFQKFRHAVSGACYLFLIELARVLLLSSDSGRGGILPDGSSSGESPRGESAERSLRHWDVRLFRAVYEQVREAVVFDATHKSNPGALFREFGTQKQGAPIEVLIHSLHRDAHRRLKGVQKSVRRVWDGEVQRCHQGDAALLSWCFSENMANVGGWFDRFERGDPVFGQWVFDESVGAGRGGTSNELSFQVTRVRRSPAEYLDHARDEALVLANAAGKLPERYDVELRNVSDNGGGRHEEVSADDAAAAVAGAEMEQEQEQEQEQQQQTTVAVETEEGFGKPPLPWTANMALGFRLLLGEIMKTVKGYDVGVESSPSPPPELNTIMLTASAFARALFKQAEAAFTNAERSHISGSEGIRRNYCDALKTPDPLAALVAVEEIKKAKGKRSNDELENIEGQGVAVRAVLVDLLRGLADARTTGETALLG